MEKLLQHFMAKLCKKMGYFASKLHCISNKELTALIYYNKLELINNHSNRKQKVIKITVILFLNHFL